MTEQEALQILGVTDETQWEEIVKKHDNLLEKHAKSGSFLPSIQSSLDQAAKECLEAVHRDKVHLITLV